MGHLSLLYVASLDLCPRRLGRVPRVKMKVGKPPLRSRLELAHLFPMLSSTGQSLAKASLARFKSRELDLLGRPATSHC